MRDIRLVTPMLTEQLRRHAAQAWSQKQIELKTLTRLTELLGEVETIVSENAQDAQKPPKKEPVVLPEGAKRLGRPPKKRDNEDVESEEIEEEEQQIQVPAATSTMFKKQTTGPLTSSGTSPLKRQPFSLKK